MKKISQLICAAMVCYMMGSCNSSADSGNGELKDSTAYFDSTAGVSLQHQREMQMNFVIEAARTTLDSINAAYTMVFNSAKVASLSVDERQQLNFALQQMNDTRELIILETQKEVLDQLQVRAAAFKTMISTMNGKSGKLAKITKSLARLSDLIQATTDALASAFSSGIIKPKLDAILK